MAGFKDLHLKTSYHRGQDDIAKDFYLPCMRRAAAYDRAVGFFRSAVFIIAWPALKAFISNGGRMRVLCSNVLADEDVDALDAGYAARIDSRLEAHFREEIRDLLNDPVLRSPTRILAALVANGTIDLKVATLKESDRSAPGTRIFHDKLGLFRDEDGEVVIFKGSMNETWSGLSSDGNLESIDVAASWLGERDLERAQRESLYFHELWEDRYPTLRVTPFPEVARSELVTAADSDWERTLEKLLHDDDLSPKDSRGRTLLSHQAAGLASWRANQRRGILDFATGSGKTFTALSAIQEAIVKRKESVLVVVPDQVLFAQWDKEIVGLANELDAKILRAGAGFDNWRSAIASWTMQDDSRRIVLATVQTASGPDFLNRLVGGQHLLLVVDEVHRLGSPHHRNLMREGLFGPRLGLSATPQRAGDPEGTAKILEFFGGILMPRYTLQDAIRDGVLCPYFYRPSPVELSENECAEWRAISAQISQIIARSAKGGSADSANTRLQHLLIKRARVVKHAAAKVPLAVRILTEHFRPGQRWIVYCEDTAQLDEVGLALAGAGVESMPFHSQMEGDRSETLKWLDRYGGVVTAIKCLDEGVDIPSVTHALILASSKNPREFVQRRGRVLRRAPNKALAYVFDAIVLPPSSDCEEKVADSFTAGELARAVEFAKYAKNPAAGADLQEIALTLGLDWASLLGVGSEDDELGT